jgi:cell pole-organizing protein PopZ
MAMNESQSEPSMEEILASIRRIIAEDDPAPTATDDVLDLAEPVAAEPAATPKPAPEDTGDELVFEDDFAEEPEEYVTPAPPVMASAPPAEAYEAHAASTAREDAILSEAVASATAAALTRLAGSMRIADDPNMTIEGMVREMIKPLLKDWLDANLRAIVDAKVEAALERVARLAR